MLTEPQMVKDIFDKIGTTNKFCVEFGISNNGDVTSDLVDNQDWTALYIEAMLDRYHVAVQKNESKPVTVLHSHITAENVNQLFEQGAVPQEPDLVSIDIDGMDYWIWKALQYTPRVVIIEYNSVKKPGVLAVKPYDPNHWWDDTRYFGASLQSMTNMANAKGYQLVGCDDYGCSAAYVRDDVFPMMGIEDNSVETLYKPARYGQGPDGGHRGPDGEYLEI